jgi:hypothetical protein
MCRALAARIFLYFYPVNSRAITWQSAQLLVLEPVAHGDQFPTTWKKLLCSMCIIHRRCALHFIGLCYDQYSLVWVQYALIDLQLRPRRLILKQFESELQLYCRAEQLSPSYRKFISLMCCRDANKFHYSCLAASASHQLNYSAACQLMSCRLTATSAPIY